MTAGMLQYPLGVGDAVTRVLEAGEGPRAALLLHGVGSRADRWSRNILPLAADGWHVYAIDLPGHGLASKGPGSYSVPLYARFVEQLVEVLGIGRMFLVGTSMGGHIAALYALEHADRLEALALVGSAGLAPLGPELRAALGGRIKDTSMEGIEHKLHNAVHDQSLVTEAWIREEFRINNSPGAATALGELSGYFRDHIDDDVVGERLASVTRSVPTLLLWGVEDRAVPLEVGREAHGLLPDTELVTIAGAGHIPYLERPEEFDAALRTFTRERSRA